MCAMRLYISDCISILGVGVRAQELSVTAQVSAVKEHHIQSIIYILIAHSTRPRMETSHS